MRKALIISILTMLLVLLTTGPVWAGVVVRMGIDPIGRLEEKGIEAGKSYLARKGTEIGYSVGGEYLFAANKDLDIGAGFEYQLMRKPQDYQKRFRFIPVYALGRYRVHARGSHSFYLTAKAGYSLFQLEDMPKEFITKEGLFYGAGIGVVFTNALHVELLYSVSRAHARIKGIPESFYKADLKYTKINLFIGYKL
ncbi:MAG: porin family protein [Clostridia bacterium]|nr:porin family protein [Clostridia bacterium]